MERTLVALHQMRWQPRGGSNAFDRPARQAEQEQTSSMKAAHEPKATSPGPGPPPDGIVVAFPWRNRTAAEAFARGLSELLVEVFPGRRSMRAATVSCRA